MKHDLPTPDQIMEELADKAAVQIDRLAPVAFDAALDELIRYHQFLLSLNATSTPDGAAFSYAEVASGFLPRIPHLQWLRQYRRLFERAADRIGEDSSFIEKLAYVPLRLLPGPADPEPTSAVVIAILNLGPTLMHRLEDWVTKRTVAENPEGQAASQRLSLAGSDRKAYESVLPNIVGAWERLLQGRPSFYQWRDKHELDATEQWSVFAKSWPFLSQHLHNTAYMLAVAVWNEDEVGADLFRDALVRWPENLSHELADQADLINRRLLYPDVLSLEWSAALERVKPILPHFLPSPSPDQLFNCILRSAHDDCILLTAALLLSWHIDEKQISDIGGRTAAALLRRELADGDDAIADSPAAGPSFRSVFLDFLRVDIAGERFRDEGYGRELDRLVSTLDGMSERRVVPGRVFSPSTLHDREGLYSSILTILVALAPSEGDDGLGQRIGELAENEPALPDADRSLRNLLQHLRALSDRLGSLPAKLDRGIAAIRADINVEAASASLKTVVDRICATIEGARERRLTERPVDGKKIEQLRSAIDQALLTPPASIHSFFRGYGLGSEETTDSAEAFEFRITGIKKGQLVEPPMDFDMVSSTESLANMTCNNAARHIWASLTRRPRENLELDFQIQELGFWRGVVQAAGRVGPDPVLLISNREEGRVLRRRFIYVRGDEKPPVNVVRKPRDDTGDLYIATIDGIDVHGADFEPGIAWLFSARSLQAVTYHAVGDSNRHVELSFESDDGITGALLVRYRQSVEWADTPVVEIKLRAPDADSTDGPVSPAT
ncbi:hypothetical protein [Mesorhizobium xinjiangense]|uniref:hypothetical protein n=1 Tax=Mesorhizobium xinjiangense TaxID=2678685 RepID=UPI0012EEB688|nr:hypothetical protein [Mesorhizobium xinjiangense]